MNQLESRKVEAVALKKKLQLSKTIKKSEKRLKPNSILVKNGIRLPNSSLEVKEIQTINSEPAEKMTSKSDSTLMVYKYFNSRLPCWLYLPNYLIDHGKLKL